MSEEISAEIAVKCSGITKVFGSVVANDGKRMSEQITPPFLV